MKRRCEMVTTNLNLSMNNPEVVQIHAKQGDSGRLYKVNLKDATEENGTLRILRPDGVEVTADAIKSASGDDYKGDLVTFDALEEVPLTKCEVTLESTQDLHGYDYPWPGGGGKNLIDYDTTVGSSTVYSPSILLSAGTYYAYVACSTGSFNCPLQISTDDSSFSNIDTTETTTAYADQTMGAYNRHKCMVTVVNPTYVRVLIQGNANTDGKNVRAMITKDSTNYSQIPNNFVDGNQYFEEIYSPYSNICPIEPSNGKNLFDKSATNTSNGYEAGKYINGNTGSVVADADCNISEYIQVEPNTTYTIYGVSGSNVGVGYYDATKTYLSGDRYAITWGTVGAKTFTTPSNAKYIRVSIIKANIDITQLEQGSSATPYVPYQGVYVYQVGVNQFNVATEKVGKKLGASTGAEETNANFCASDYIWVMPNTEYYFGNITRAVETNGIFWYDENKTFIISNGASGGADHKSSTTKTSPANARYLRIVHYVGIDEVGVNYPSTITSYQPYQGNTYPISLGQNVYGGKVDLVSGKLTITHGIYTFSGNEAWTLQSGSYGGVKYYSTSYLVASSAKLPADNSKSVPIITSIGFFNYSYNQLHTHPYAMCIAADGRVGIEGNLYNPNGDTLKDVQMVYELATPIEVDLTPTQISTLLGTNNIWSSGEVEVAFEYDGLFAQLPQQATEVVGRCLGDVDFNGASTMPFTLNVIPNNQEETP